MRGWSLIFLPLLLAWLPDRARSVSKLGHPAYDAAEQSGKEHIGNGVTLADDPEFAKRPDSAVAVEDPGCENAPGWPDYRERLRKTMLTESWQDAAADAHQWLTMRNMFNATLLDEEAGTCLFGVIASLYLLARYSFEEDGSWESAVYVARSLDGYASSLHPGKLDEGTDYGQLWPFTDFDLGSLRRTLSKASANRTTTKWKNHEQNDEGQQYVGNAFSASPDDEVEGGVTLAASLKVFVYAIEDYPELRLLTRGAAFCKDNQWGFEVALHEWFLACPCRTDDPTQADFFFVPHYTACHLNVETFTEAESNALFSALVTKLSHYHRSRGRDHVFVWGGGFGADGPFRSWRQYIADSVFLMTEPELWNPYHNMTVGSYSPWKDVLIPGKLALRDIVGTAAVAPPPDARFYLADFVGWNRPLHRSQGGSEVPSPRAQVLAMAGEADLHIRQDVPYQEAAVGALSSRFCFVPRGKSAWSSRFFRVLFAGCIPVLLNDFYEPPFGELFDTSGLAVRWPMKSVDGRMLEALRAVSMEGLARILTATRQRRCWYVYIPSVIDLDHIELQNNKLDAVCPRWRSENAFMAIFQLLRRRRRASHAPVPGAAFFVPQEDGQLVQVDAKLWRVA